MANWEPSGHDRGGGADEPLAGPMIDHVVPIAPSDGPPDFPEAPAFIDDAAVLHTAYGDPSRFDKAAFWLVPDDRPAPPAPRRADPWIAVLIVSSLIGHTAIAALFDTEPEPLPSIGVVSLSVDLVVGDDLAPGNKGALSPVETAAPGASPDADRIDTAPREAGRPAGSWIERMAAFQQIAPAQSQERAATPSADRPPQQASAQPPKQADEKANVIASIAAESSIGRGESTADATYPGIVAARLARFKQYPAAARKRGQQGGAVVTFTLDGDGSVTHVELTKKSGVASLDSESLAMVRRAAPFPPTPTGGPMSFTVPVNFSLAAGP